MESQTFAETRCKGKIIAKGYGEGALLFFYSAASTILVNKVTAPKDKMGVVEDEIDRFQEACKKTEEEVQSLSNELSASSLQEGKEIVDSLLYIIQDPEFHRECLLAMKRGALAESALQETVAFFSNKFSRASDAFFQERFKDLEEIAKRIMFHLHPLFNCSLPRIEKPGILVCQEASSLLIAAMDPSQVVGIITQTGSSTSHAAILARARGVPFLANVEVEKLAPGEAILDGHDGWIIQNPSSATKREFNVRKEQFQRELKRLYSLSPLPPETYDGCLIRLLANIDFESEIELLELYGASGIGLFRSEMVFSRNSHLPHIQEQVDLYSRIIKRLKGAPFTLRTFDMSPDKWPAWQERAENPYLSIRTFRSLLREKKVIRDQIKALLQAALFGEARLLFPMIVDLSDLREAKALFEEAKAELTKEGKRFNPKVSIGAMIEVPSAAIIADQLLEEVDFVSIGTNDLVQYSLAQERNCEDPTAPAMNMHPSLIRLIKAVSSVGSSLSVPVSLCGEMAIDPRLIPLLIGLGILEFSMAPRFIPLIKEAIRGLSLVECQALAKRVLKMSTKEEIEEALL